MPAAVQRNAIAAFRHRFTLRQTRRTVPIMFSIELVQASERLSFIGKPRRLTVSISSSPSRLYALDITLDLKGATKSQMERAMQGHVLANAELIGTYQKGDR